MTNPRDQGLRVGLVDTSGREHLVRQPLRAAGQTVIDSPADPADCDVILTDTPGPDTLRAGLESTPTVLRLRGNLWREYSTLRFGRARALVNDFAVFGVLDGVLAPDRRLREVVNQRTRAPASWYAGLPIDPEEWPSVKHRRDELRALTLTNLDYQGKTEPLLDWVPVVERALRAGEQWVIGGDGEHAGRVAAACEDCERVSYRGFVDAGTHLAQSNLLLHPSRFDISMPNAVLEGVASGLPVVTTRFPPLAAGAATRGVAADELPAVLKCLRDPADRRRRTEHHPDVLRQHRPQRIGEQLARGLYHAVDVEGRAAGD